MSAVLFRFTDQLFRARGVEDIYDAALGAIVEALECSRASILLFDSEGLMRFVAWRGLSAAYRRAADGHTPWRPGQTDAEPIFIPDIELAHEPDALKQAILDEGVRSLAFVPLTIGGAVVGKFMIYHDRVRVFSGREADLAQTIARQLGFSLERLRADEALRMERELLQTIIDRIPVMIAVYEPQKALTRVNRAFEKVLGWTSQEAAGASLMERLFPDPYLCEQVRSFMLACPEGWLDAPMVARSGARIETSWANVRLSDNTQVGIGLDITSRKQAEAALERYAHRLVALNRALRTLSQDLQLDHLAQVAVDSAAELIGATVGALFYTSGEGDAQDYELRVLSGSAREAPEDFTAPARAAFFAETFEGEGAIRLDDVRSDPRYGPSDAEPCAPEARAPIVSFLAVPVVSRSGRGGLVFGRPEAAMFSQEDEDIVSAIAAQTAIAMDNAALLAAKQQEIEQRRRAEVSAQRLAAIVESSEDAILGKDLDGVITSWNAAAERLLGYGADEALGQSVRILVPAERREEEERILAKIRAGDRVPPFETVRLSKGGEELAVSLSVSPVRDGSGTIVGASTIARDITERLRAQERQQLLLREMDHRIKNLFTLVGALVTLSARNASDAMDCARAVRGRLDALARAHALTLDGHRETTVTSLHALLETVLSPYGAMRAAVTGPDVRLRAEAVTAVALLLHELATNAAKYGALSNEVGRLEIACSRTAGRFGLEWTERDGPGVVETDAEGFGTRLVKATVVNQLAGEVSRRWRPEGLVVRVSLPLERLSAEEADLVGP